MKFDFNKITEKINSFIDCIKTAFKEKRLNSKATIALIAVCALLFSCCCGIGAILDPSSGEVTSSEIANSEIVSSAESKSETINKKTASLQSTESRTVLPADLSDEEFVNIVKKAIDGQVGKGEKIESVTMKNRHLKIVADISKAELPEGFELSFIADSRVSGITDEILARPELDAYWDKITVVIEPIGSVTFDKSDIVNGEYGRYFEVSEDSFS